MTPTEGIDMSVRMPPHLEARYGIRSTPKWQAALVALAVAAFVGALGWVGYTLTRPSITSNVLRWNVVSAERTDITFEVRRGEADDTYCVLRAQDEDHIDVGYAVVGIPRGTTYAQVNYSLRTLAPSYVAEVLACEAGTPPTRVIPPQFPPGVAPPPQPWTP